MVRVDADFFKHGGKNLRFRKYPDTRGRGQILCLGREQASLDVINMLGLSVVKQKLNQLLANYYIS